MEPMFSIEHLNFSFSDRDLYHDLNAVLEPGTITALLGANGVGKTTLIKLLMGQLTPTSGEIKRAANLKLGYVPQFRNLDVDYPLAIRAFVQLSQLTHKRIWHTQAEKQALDQALADTVLTEKQHQLIGMASGGEKQRAYLAQALVNQPNFLILDEATASLDVNAKNELMSLVRGLNVKHGMTVLMVTHDLELAKQYSNQYLLLTKDGYDMQSIDHLDLHTIPKELIGGTQAEVQDAEL